MTNSPNPPHGRWVLLSTILASSMAFIDGTALNVALPVLQQELNGTAIDLLWVLNGYLLMLAALTLVGGSLGDKFGRKRLFQSGILLFVTASVACGFAPNINILIWARVAQGLGGALMIPGSLSLISALFPADIRGQAIGTWSAVSSMVTILGPALGGILASNGLWRGIFFINVPLGIIALLALTQVPESKDQEAAAHPTDVLGGLLTMLGLGGITYGFITISESGASPDVWGSLIIGFIALVGFVWWENYTSAPMMPLTIFRNRTFSAANLLTLFLYATLQIFSLFLSLNLVQLQGYSPAISGLAFLPLGMMIVLFSRPAGRLADRIGPRPLLTVGPIVTGCAFLWLSFIGKNEGLDDIWLTFVPGLLLFGLGMSLVVAPLTAAVMTSLPDQYTGVASGINNAVSRTAGVLGVAIIGALAILIFTAQLTQAAAILPAEIDTSLQQELLLTANQLAETTIPAAANAEQATLMGQAITQSFINMYQIIMQICAGLAFTSALIAFLFVESTKKTTATPHRLS